MDAITMYRGMIRAGVAALCVLGAGGIVGNTLPYAAAQEAAGLPAGARAFKDLAYAENGHARQKLDLYVPASPKGPLLVWIHGGGWVGGSKDPAQGLPMLGQGYCVASVEYRFSQDAVFPAQIEDCKAAIRWLRAHAKEYGYDPKRIAVWGASAGGHLTALLATTGTTRKFDVGANLDQSSAIQCGIDFFGPTDFPGYQPPKGSEAAVGRSEGSSLLVKLLGGPVEAKKDLARDASPVTWVSRDSAPLYIEQGTKDPLVPVSQSERLAEKYRKAGAEVTLDIVSGAGHGGPEFLDADRITKLLAFLNKHVGGK